MKYQTDLWSKNHINDEVHAFRSTTKDVLEQAEALPFWQQEYTQLDKGSFTGSVVSVASHGVQIFREPICR